MDDLWGERGGATPTPLIRAVVMHSANVSERVQFTVVQWGARRNLAGFREIFERMGGSFHKFRFVVRKTLPVASRCSMTHSGRCDGARVKGQVIGA